MWNCRASESPRLAQRTGTERLLVGTPAYLDEMLAESFEAFTFSPYGAAIYQLGTYFGPCEAFTVAQIVSPSRIACNPKLVPNRQPRIPVDRTP